MTLVGERHYLASKPYENMFLPLLQPKLLERFFSCNGGTLESCDGNTCVFVVLECDFVALKITSCRSSSVNIFTSRS